MFSEKLMEQTYRYIIIELTTHLHLSFQKGTVFVAQEIYLKTQELT